MQVGKEIKRIITFETNSIGEPMAVVIYKKKATPAPAPPSLETAQTNAKTVLEKIVDSQIEAANEFKVLNEQAGSDWFKELGKNISLAIIKGGSALETK